jgi:hypothetical protein
MNVFRCSPRCPSRPADVQERPGLGRADDDPPVNARRDDRGGPLDPVDRVRAEKPEFDGVAEGQQRPQAREGLRNAECD